MQKSRGVEYGKEGQVGKCPGAPQLGGHARCGAVLLQARDRFAKHTILTGAIASISIWAYARSVKSTGYRVWAFLTFCAERAAAGWWIAGRRFAAISLEHPHATYTTRLFRPQGFVLEMSWVSGLAGVP